MRSVISLSKTFQLARHRLVPGGPYTLYGMVQTTSARAFISKEG